MISSVNFPARVNFNPGFTVKSNPHLGNNPDTFEKTASPVDQTVYNAKRKIMEVLKDSGIEFGFTISKDGKVLEESSGNENSCPIDSRKVEPDSILIHGHPRPYPLSTGDVAILLSTNAKTTEAVTVDGKYSRLTKKHPQVSQMQYIDLYPALEKQLNIKVLNELGIDYKMNKQDLLKLYKDYLENQRCCTMSDEDAIKNALDSGIDFQNNELEEIERKVFDKTIYYRLTHPYMHDKVHNSIVENYDKIKEYADSPRGIELRNEFLYDIAEQYDLIYETNLFD